MSIEINNDDVMRVLLPTQMFNQETPGHIQQKSDGVIVFFPRPYTEMYKQCKILDEVPADALRFMSEPEKWQDDKLTEEYVRTRQEVLQKLEDKYEPRLELSKEISLYFDENGMPTLPPAQEKAND
jgi:hypothetical protein